jgi:hypothetical protein
LWWRWYHDDTLQFHWVKHHFFFFHLKISVSSYNIWTRVSIYVPPNYTPTILDLDQSIYICTPQITQTTFFLSKIIVFCLFFLQNITWWPCFSQNLELYYTCTKCIWFNFWCFNATFSNISAISWRPVLVVEEAGGPGENHQPWASNW